jgi:hypothetical protein
VIFKSHPAGLAGLRAEIDKKVAAGEAEFAKASSATVARLKIRGREAVAEFLANPSSSSQTTQADREALARFLAEYAPLDNLRDAGARRLRDVFLHIEAIADLLPVPASSWRRRICPIAPWAIIGGAIIGGVYEPLRDISYVACRFLARSSFGNPAEYEFIRLFYEPSPPPTWLIVICVGISIFAGWRAVTINLSVAVAIFTGAKLYFAVAAVDEWKVPAFCSPIDAQTGAPRAPSIEQRLRIRDALTR